MRGSRLQSSAGNGGAPLATLLRGVGHHDHLCLIYRTCEEQFAAVIPFMRIGLERGERCVYIADDTAPSSVIEAMRADGIDVETATAAGALSILNKRDAYVQRGSFDPDWMIQYLAESTEAARRAGFSGLRATGEMTWMLAGDPGAERLIEYEAKLNDFFPHHPVVALCQYDRCRFTPELIADVIRTHPIIVYDGMVCRNFYYVPPDEFLRPSRPALETQRLLDNILDRERADAEILRLNAELERRVAERTVELEAANRLKDKLLELRRYDQEEIERLNQHLLRRATELEATNKELEAFAYSASHDLRAPLRHLEGFAELLLKRAGADLDETSARYARAIADSAAKMSRLIEELLNFSRTSRAEMHTQRVELAPLVQEVQRDLAPVMQGRRITWSVGRLPAVEADPILLRLALTNLLSNAIKFTAVRAEACIEIGASEENGDAAIFVRDNGVGFDSQYGDKLFGVFQRLHREEEFEGTGIGLATVRRIVRRHGGRVWADGAVDRGATFYFTLPIAKG